MSYPTIEFVTVSGRLARTSDKWLAPSACVTAIPCRGASYKLPYAIEPRRKFSNGSSQQVGGKPAEAAAATDPYPPLLISFAAGTLIGVLLAGR